MCSDELNSDLKLNWVPEDFLETQNLDEGGGLSRDASLVIY